MITIAATGPLSLLQDGGRFGQSHLGVSASGAADRGALRLGNRLVGNPEGAAVIESLFGGLEIITDAPAWVTVTGASTVMKVDGHLTGSHTLVRLEAGSCLSVRPPAEGLRTYLAVRGGFTARSVLGSRSTDTLSGIGPDPLTPGTQLAVGRPGPRWPGVEHAPAYAPEHRLALSPGPRLDWFTVATWTRLTTTAWTVSSDADRVAVRLTGAALERRVLTELPSEGLLRGAVQVPADGAPLVFGPDHPVTGGYPVIAVLTGDACDHLAQLRPGDVVRFSESARRARRPA